MSQFIDPKDGGVQNDFAKFQSTEMLNFGLTAGQNILNQQRAKLLPRVSDLWSNLKLYFAVSNRSVLQKLIIVIYPFRNKAWGRTPVDELGLGKEEVELYTSHKWELPKHDINAPDLYLPLMSFITYALLIGLQKGLQAVFTPDLLIQSITRCLMLQIFETLLIKFGLSVMSVPLPFLDIFAYTGYKYVGLSLNTIAKNMGRLSSLVSAVYICSTLAYFILKSMAAVVPATHSTGPPRHLMLLGFAATQFIVAFILCTL